MKKQEINMLKQWKKRLENEKTKCIEKMGKPLSSAETLRILTATAFKEGELTVLEYLLLDKK